MKRQQLQERIRRSSSFSPSQRQEFYLEYVKMVKDQSNVYEYMEQNKIGVDNPKYWLSRFQSLEKMCQYVKIVKLIHKIRKNINLKKHPNYYKIVQYEADLDKRLIYKIKSHFYGKRNIKNYQSYSSALFPIKKQRKFGKIQIYVDDLNQKNYSLEDNALFIQEKLRDSLDIDINAYLRAQQNKEQHLKKLAHELLGKKDPYNNNQIRSSTALSKQKKSSQKKHFTPTKKQSSSQQNKQQSSSDSREKLKGIVWKQRDWGKISPKFTGTPIKNPQYQQKSKQQVLNLININNSLQFSFNRILSQSTNQNQNNARIQYDQDQLFQRHSTDSFNLGLAIHQLQHKITQTETFTSQINSNQENLDVFNETVKQIQEDRIRLRVIEKQRLNQKSLQELLDYSLDAIDTLKVDKSDECSLQHKKDITFSQKTNRKSGLSAISEEKSYSFSYINSNKLN